MPETHMGAMLRERREELGISLEMAATATNIRARVLRVLEEGDYANFPPYGHAMGMISSYARYLDTDPRPILQEFEREWADFEAGDRMRESAERTRRGVGRFGERAMQGGQPSQRSQRRAQEQQRRGAGGQDTGSIHAKLDDERIAEEDDRYKSGTVRVVGTRQTGDFRRVGARRPRGSARGETGAGARGRMEARGRDGGRYERHAGRAGTGSTGPSAPVDRADRLYDRDASTTGETGTGRRGAAAGASRASSRYSRYSSGRYTSRSRRGSGDARGERRAASGQRADGAASRHAAPLTGATGGETARDGAREGTSEKRTPDYFSIEKLDRAERSQAERAGSARRKERAGDSTSADDGLVARVVSVVTEAFSERRTRAIAIGIAAFVVVVVIVAGVLISTAGSGDSGVIAVEGGAADTTKSTSDPNSASATVTTTNGNPVNVSIDVAEGQTSLISVTYDDDNAYSGTAVGAWHREFLVTESLEATFGNPDAVTVTENGNPVNIDKSDDGTGKMSLTIKTTSTSTTSGSAEDSSSGSKSKKKSSKKKSGKNSSSSSSSE